MDIRGLVKAEKDIKQPGRWTTGTMPKTAFPLSKSGSKAYRLGNRRWRVVTFEVAGLECRLLINYHPMLLQYQAMLGIDIGGDTKVLASLELHPTHGGWHIHASCDDIASVPSGLKRGPWNKGLSGSGPRFRTPCPDTDEAAFHRAVSFFRLDRTSGEGGLL
jgi:hypothetical protein